MQIWSVYLVRCADDSLYCGVTTDMDRRLREHNGLKSGGAKYTKTRRPVSVCVCVACESRSEALKLEDRIQKLPRHKKITTLQSFVANHGIV